MSPRFIPWHLVQRGVASIVLLDQSKFSLSSLAMKQIFAQMSSTLNRFELGISVTRLRAEFVLAFLSGLVLVFACASLFNDVAGVVAACVLFTIGAAFTALAMNRLYPHAEFGLCNLVTMTRLALTLSLVPLLLSSGLAPSSDMWTAFTIAAITLSLDGVDGWTARRAGLVSRFGARFDMEVDSVFALLLALIAYVSGQAGLWIIVLGLPRYAFWIAATIWPRLADPLPDSLLRKGVCVFQIGTLTAFLVPILPGAVVTFGAALTAVALAGSFFTDIRQLMSNSQ